MIELSNETSRRVKSLFPEKEWEVISRMLAEECGDNLPMVDPDYVDLAERIRFSVLKLSDGDYGKLLNEIHEASRDWRDILMAAGFGNDPEAHLEWEP
jgi:hypothetical protein